ncbi:MAG: hypothetical protein Q4B70_14315, partial [Lachnospiraceae bacterium]|nr:hypothetical protein [Lachnospiraceae bacterium]
QREDEKGLSCNIEMDSLVSQDFNLNPARYLKKEQEYLTPGRQAQAAKERLAVIEKELFVIEEKRKLYEKELEFLFKNKGIEF